MKPRILTSTILSLFLLSTNSFAFEHISINSFKNLNDFNSVQEFEKYYNSYIQECLDNGVAGRESIPCFVSYKLWDKELNIYYDKLLSKLTKDEKALLESSQKAWLKSRDLTREFDSGILDKIYNEEGTLNLLMRAGATDSSMSNVIKERALILKNWSESIK